MVATTKLERANEADDVDIALDDVSVCDMQ